MTLLRYRILLLLAGIALLAGCAMLGTKDESADRAPQTASEQLLVKGIKSYEDGEYKNATKQLQDALSAGLPRKTDSARARKYLAFIACSANNTNRCRDEFRKAFESDPNFSLDAAETGHPVWGPVYRGVRDQIKGKGR
jgi:Tfp pilus assembly protein PilF